ncbi:hypothetical protein PP459_gp126 [Streptomyces phage Wakanda]|uniref:Uncharacterized protein n=2 Tax=Wakandavirus TaxID=3044854 RepID=A0A6G8R3A5_9CAUD|nr:hypothetical protein PP459_gp126 [Streptomyces phage Wakanda]YP_010652428.1 hypothetical protein PP460_gp130 [Streptomyces phage Muntaha]QIN94107.1 hypothetical protein SEA_WAKANDA_140 [Streptomyces phage Wakanda]QIN94672.1 hypothetical protein SEA_MUNTAHA_141 [Streptomyces phage Muntaha]
MAEEKNEQSRRLLSADERREAVKRSEDEAAKTEYKPRTAHDVVGEVGPVDVADAKERAREAGVTDAAFVGYEEALHNYESRPDVETLKERRAREAGETFDEAGFRRQVGAVDNAGVVSTDTAVKTDEKEKAVAEDKTEAKPAARKSAK